MVARFHARYRRGSGCWLWLGKPNRYGYGRLSVGARGAAVELLAHRIAWALAYGDIPAGMMVCHSCDTPPCVRPDHLFLGTNVDNVADRHAKGRDGGPPAGEAHFNAKLRDSQVAELRAAYAVGGVTQQQLADRFGVSRSLVGLLVTYRRRA